MEKVQFVWEPRLSGSHRAPMNELAGGCFFDRASAFPSLMADNTGLQLLFVIGAFKMADRLPVQTVSVQQRVRVLPFSGVEKTLADHV